MKTLKWIAVNGFKITCIFWMSVYDFWNGMMSDWSEIIDSSIPVYIPKRPETLIINFGDE